MKKKSIIFMIVLIMLVFLQGQARASVYFITGDALFEEMRGWDKCVNKDPGCDPIKAQFYMGYVAGVVDASVMTIPREATLSKICSIVSSYLKNHPERLGEPAAGLVVDALMEVFPPPR